MKSSTSQFIVSAIWAGMSGFNALFAAEILRSTWPTALSASVALFFGIGAVVFAHRGVSKSILEDLNLNPHLNYADQMRYAACKQS